MGSVTNPMFAGLVPGGNPTGNQLSLLSLLPNQKGSNALVSQDVPGGPSSAASTNPYGVVPGTTTPQTTPAFPVNTGPYPSSGGSVLTPPSAGTPAPGTPGNYQTTASQSPVGGINLMSQKDLSRLFSDLKKTYGDGMAHMILDFLMTGAGFNQSAVNNLLASLQPGIQRGEEDLMSQFSASGNRFGSGAQIGLGDYLSRVNLNEGELVTQMYEQSLQDFMDVMMGTSGKVAGTRASSPSLLDSILGGIGLGGQAAGGISSIISSISPTADTGILDAIAGAAAFA